MIKCCEGPVGTRIKCEVQSIQGLQQPDGFSIFKGELEKAG